jgi:hypothetical protein
VHCAQVNELEQHTLKMQMPLLLELEQASSAQSPEDIGGRGAHSGTSDTGLRGSEPSFAKGPFAHHGHAGGCHGGCCLATGFRER